MADFIFICISGYLVQSQHRNSGHNTEQTDILHRPDGLLLGAEHITAAKLQIKTAACVVLRFKKEP